MRPASRSDEVVILMKLPQLFVSWHRVRRVIWQGRQLKSTAACSWIDSGSADRPQWARHAKMIRFDSINRKHRMRSRTSAVALVARLLLTNLVSLPASAQDSRELQQERVASNKLNGEHPLSELMRTRNSKLRPELMGVPPG